MAEIRFGVSGYPRNFTKEEIGKQKENIFSWLHDMDLHALLLDWSKIHTLSDKKITKYIMLAKQYDIQICIKASKELNFLSFQVEEEQKSLEQLKKAIELTKKLASHDLIFTLGETKSTLDHKVITKHLIKILKPLLKDEDINFHIEPSCTPSVYGSLSELLEISKSFDNVYPSFNLIHLHAYNHCNLISTERITRLLKQISDTLGQASLNDLIVQICPLSYEHGHFIPKTFGERKTGQLSFFDSNFEYFPKAIDYIQAIRAFKITPTTFSNTYKTEEIGAMRLRDSYFYTKMKEVK